MSARSLMHANFECFLAEEAVYLASLKKEPAEDMQLALECHTLQKETSRDGDYALVNLQALRRMKQAYTAAFEKVNHCLKQLNVLETALGIESQWTPASQEYVNTKKEAMECTYHLALNHLERLVMQQLFELQKANLESAGYKLHMQIAKHLKTQSETIRAAVKAYNIAAGALMPPQLSIDFKTVVQYTFLCEFDLLCNTRQDICELQWAKPNIHILTNTVSPKPRENPKGTWRYSPFPDKPRELIFREFL
ncbi:hypothetical protein FRB95_014515 [Tulasnella sp. JGI-2019a]|nr:hypothetical protein FRB95_014515 [Tulasnella sp. JGI-2019a]